MYLVVQEDNVEMIRLSFRRRVGGKVQEHVQSNRAIFSGRYRTSEALHLRPVSALFRLR